MRTEEARFARAVALRTAGAWVWGVLALCALAATLSRDTGEEALDLRLRAHGLAVYGLGWFDAAGAFHDEVLERETKLLATDIDVLVWSETGPVFRSGTPRVPPDRVGSIVAQVLASNHEVWADGADAAGQPYRLFALPTYDDADRLAGAVIAIGDPRTGRRAWLDFVQRLVVGAALLIAAGLGASALLAAHLHRHLHAGIRARERFLAGAAHELRTPVATLRAVVESAQMGDEPSDRALVRIGGIATETSDLVERLLTLARLDALVLEREPLRLDLLVDTCLEDGEPATLEPCVVHGDPRLLKVVVLNLLRNARTHGRGIHEVRVADGALAVLDRGPGLPAGLDLTAPFVRGPDSAGSGLGLTLVARIVAAHGGTHRLGPGAQVVVGLGVNADDWPAPTTSPRRA